jgi:hypothetical protein
VPKHGPLKGNIERNNKVYGGRGIAFFGFLGMREIREDKKEGKEVEQRGYVICTYMYKMKL